MAQFSAQRAARHRSARTVRSAAFVSVRRFASGATQEGSLRDRPPPARARPRQRRTRLAGRTLIAIAMMLAGAGCGATPGLPSLPGSHPASSSPHSAGLAATLITCLRKSGYHPPPGFNPYSPTFRTLRLPPQAVAACNSLILKILPPLTDKQKQEVIDFVVCLRRHGIPAGDPVFQGPSYNFSLGPGVDIASPAFAKAQNACASQLPQRGR